LYFEWFIAEIDLKVSKCIKCHYIRSEIFLLEISQYMHKKIRIFMLISKMSTYISVKMHPKKVLAQKQIFRDYIFLKTVFCLKLFLGAFCH
jgi:hypothetical protein